MSKYNKEFGDRLFNIRKERGLTMNELGKLVGLHESTVKRYENGEIKTLDIEKVKEFARALNVSEIYLMGWQENKSTSKAIPLLGTIAAGTPILAQDNIERHFYLDSSIKADFALRIKGDSMINVGINEGDIVFIRQQPDIENGEIGAVQIQDIECEATLKRVYKDNNSITLVSENPKYPPKILTSGNVRILGKLVAVLSMKE